MSESFQARWVSKNRSEQLRKTGRLGRAVLLDAYNGFILAEPVGSNLGDGEIMSPDTADYEVRPVWCLSPPTKVRQARRLLGLKEIAPEKTNPDVESL